MVESAFANYPYNIDVQIEMANLNIRRNQLDEDCRYYHSDSQSKPHNLRAVNMLARILMKNMGEASHFG